MNSTYKLKEQSHSKETGVLYIYFAPLCLHFLGIDKHFPIGCPIWLGWDYTMNLLGKCHQPHLSLESTEVPKVSDWPKVTHSSGRPHLLLPDLMVSPRAIRRLGSLTNAAGCTGRKVTGGAILTNRKTDRQKQTIGSLSLDSYTTLRKWAVLDLEPPDKGRWTSSWFGLFTTSYPRHPGYQELMGFGHVTYFGERGLPRSEIFPDHWIVLVWPVGLQGGAGVSMKQKASCAHCSGESSHGGQGETTFQWMLQFKGTTWFLLMKTFLNWIV